jgi:putative hemolysin
MSERIAFELILILFLVVANGVFAMSEIALVSSRKTRLQSLARQGSKRAARAFALAERPDRFLSTVQIGITLIGVFAGAFGGATLADQIDEHLETFPALGPYSEAIGVAVVVLGITYLSVVLGELVPKRLALNAPERIAIAVAPAMDRAARVAAPVVWFLTVSTRAILWLLRVRESTEPPVTEEELKALLRLGMNAGTVEREEREIVERVFRLGERSVTALMTPHADVEWLDLAQPLSLLRDQAANSRHEWFPVAVERIDRIEGIVRAPALWSREFASSAEIRQVLEEPLRIPERTSAFSLLQRFRESRNHVAIVIDESGGVVGMVTPTDVLEALVGELPQRGDLDEPMIVQRDDHSWSLDAAIDLEEVKLLLGLDHLEDQRDGFQTLGGYLATRVPHPPRIGQSFDVQGLRFEITDVDGRRIDRILLQKLRPQRSIE